MENLFSGLFFFMFGNGIFIYSLYRKKKYKLTMLMSFIQGMVFAMYLLILLVALDIENKKEKKLDEPKKPLYCRV